MTDFDPNWKWGHITRDGRKARIICTDKASEYPIVALIRQDHGSYEEYSVSCNAEGRVYKYEKSNQDLINTPAPRKKVWVNLFYVPDIDMIDAGRTWPSKEKALEEATKDCVATIQVEIPEE